MLIGYARVSRADQNLEAQTDELTRAGCKRIFTDKISGATRDRPGLAAALNHAREGDAIVVVRLDRRARSLLNFVETVNDLTARKINIKSLHEGVDTSTAAGRTFCYIFSVLAEAEREWIIERTRAECCCSSVCHFLEMWPRMLDRYLNERTREICRSLIDINLN